MAAVALAAVAGLADTGRHTVRSGETLGRIARRYNTTAQAIAEANGIANLNLIVTGQVLVIPNAPAPAPAPAAPPSAPAPAPSGTVHVVRRGETLFEIAQRYDTTVDAIIAVNAIANRRLIHPGQQLALPTGGGGGAAPAPGATPAPAAAPAVVPSGTVHTVRPGETLGRIARRYGTSAQAIAALNGLSNLNVVRSGAQLAIPGTAPVPAAGSAGPGVHIVQSGETLASVAAAHGLAPEALAAANGLTAPFTLYVGNRLFLAPQNAAPVPGLAACPVPGSTFINDFGFPRPGSRFHNGIDMLAPMGAPVLAPVSGRVQHISGPLGGHQFILRGDDGNRYAGSHLSGFGTGGRVAAGTVIGYVGNTGNAVGGQTHLHIEVRPGGGASVNPFSALDAVC